MDGFIGSKPITRFALIGLSGMLLGCPNGDSNPVGNGTDGDVNAQTEVVTGGDTSPTNDVLKPASSVTLTLQSNASITPFSGYRGGFFPRIFYNANDDGFDFFLQGIIDPKPVSGPPNEFVAVKLDRNLQVVSTPVRLGLSAASGDMAMAQKDGHYFHIAGKKPGWVLAKIDASFQVVDEVEVTHDEYDRANDMVMNVTGNHLTLMTLHASMKITPELMSGPGIWEEPTYGHLFFYDTDLKMTAPEVVLDVDFMSFGASVAQTDQGYAIITADALEESVLSAYLFDANWAHQETKKLADNGQWSQGVVVHQGVTYVAYHEGPHSFGDLIVSAFGPNWDLLSTVNVTQFPTSGVPNNALRPWLIRVDDTLYVSFDSAEGGDPKARVAVIKISND